MKIWDKDENLIEEKEIRINDIDPANADSYELYALSVYGEKSGQNKEAVLSFVLAQDIKESAESDYEREYDPDISEEADRNNTAVTDDADNKRTDSVNDREKEAKTKEKKVKNPIEEIEDICRRYIPNINGESVKTESEHVNKPKEVKAGSKINVAT